MVYEYLIDLFKGYLFILPPTMHVYEHIYVAIMGTNHLLFLTAVWSNLFKYDFEYYIVYCCVAQGGPVGELVQWTDLIVVSNESIYVQRFLSYL